jgi:excisionase family DNA binding protein
MIKMNNTNQVNATEVLKGVSRFSTTSVTSPSVFTNKIATVAPNPNEHIYAELADIKMILQVIIEKLAHQQVEKSDLIDLDEACTLLNMSKSSMYKKTAHKEIPFIKRVGTNKLLFSRNDLTKWVSEEPPSISAMVDEHIHRKLRVTKMQSN